MKKITKTTEPMSLREYRSSISQSDRNKLNVYEDYSDGGVLRKQLLEEQGYICCYCMSRISERNSKIEHFKAQSKYREFQINYGNLFVACKGGEGAKEQYCDTAKANQDLNHIDFFSNIEEKIKYFKNGKVSSLISSKNEMSSLTKEMEDVLNLNSKILIENRKQTYDDFKKKKRWSKLDLQKAIVYYQNQHNGKYTPYSEMMVYLLNKKLQGK